VFECLKDVQLEFTEAKKFVAYLIFDRKAVSARAAQVNRRKVAASGPRNDSASRHEKI
jgi:hypothetical protein